MRLAGGLGLAAVISAADAITVLFGTDWQVPSDRAGPGGDSRPIGNKHKAGEITQSAAEDFVLLTCRTTSEHHTADFSHSDKCNPSHSEVFKPNFVCYYLIIAFTQPSYCPADVLFQTDN